LRVALVTSSQTAALQDMLKVLRRYPWLQLCIYHAPVQGDGAAEKIAAAIHHLSAQHQTARSVDVILLARGGGSLEDLWEFNEEIVARAIVASPIPIVTGIGHEVDTSIADLAADHHAHTPTEAAQTIVQLWKSARDVLDASGIRLRRGENAIVADAQQRLAGIRRHEMFRRPMDRVNQLRQLLDDRQRAMSLGIGERLRIAQRQVEQFNERLERHRPETLLARVRQRLAELDRALFDSAHSRIRILRDRLQDIVAMFADRNPKHEIRLRSQQTVALADRLQRAGVGDIERRTMGLDGLQGRLEALAPQNVLRRGYSLTMLKKGRAIIRNAGQLRPGDKLVTRFADGQVESTVNDPRQLPLFE
jgi:exodeoxyribonuclease VII large subunit